MNTQTTLQWVLRGLNRDGSVTFFYSGRAGKFWVLDKDTNAPTTRETAFRYDTKEAAIRKAMQFNKMEPLHGIWFHATTSE